jgi:hypothetical protein
MIVCTLRLSRKLHCNTSNRFGQELNTSRIACPSVFSTSRYHSGYSRYLEALDAQRQLLQAQTLQISPHATCGWRWSISPRRWAEGWEYNAAVARS